MSSAGRWLERRGFEVHNLGYPSRRHDLIELAVLVDAELGRRFSGESRRINFLTHSMGGIVLRQILALREEGTRPSGWRLGRAVLLASPNRGSRLAAALADRWAFRFLFGSAGQQLRTGAACSLARLPMPPSAALIAGTRSVGLFRLVLRAQLSSGANSIPDIRIPDNRFPDNRFPDNDGTVAVNEVEMPGVPLRTVPAGHTFLMNNREALELAVAFLRNGRFP